MEIALGLDVSTSITGIVALEYRKDFDITQHMLRYSICNLTNEDSFWKKTDKLQIDLKNLVGSDVVKAVYVEEPLKRFAAGFSSANTISVLQRMNGIACYQAYHEFGVEPTYINVSAGRKSIGIKLLPTKKHPDKWPAKRQTYELMMKGDLKSVQFPKKRTGNLVDGVSDVVDAYVICRSGLALYS